MKTNRTIEALQVEALRKGAQKVYVYMPDEETKAVFVRDAIQEGYRFGTHLPIVEALGDNIVALWENKTLAHLNFLGHMAFHNPQAVVGGCIRVDYKKYRSGEEDYTF